MTHRVVITGMGPVTAIGTGKDEFFRNLHAHQTNIQPIPKSYEQFYPFRSKHLVPLPDVSLAEHNIPPSHTKAMQPEDRMGVLAAMLALQDAGFTIEPAEKKLRVPELADCPVVLGTGFSGLENCFQGYVDHALPDRAAKERYFPRARFKRMVIPMVMPNSPAAWISIIFSLTGRAHTVNAACASGTYAVGDAFRLIRDGYCRTALTGGVENLADERGAIMRGFDMLGVLTDSGDGMPMPFSHQRNGFLFAEGGACVLVLEELEHARQRGADIYAEIIDFQANSDACSIVRLDSSGTQIERLLRALARHGPLDYLNCHGTGTHNNDEVEASVIRRVFGPQSQQPYLNTTKAILGHTLGASGAIEAAVTAMAIKTGKLHPNRIREPLEDLNLVHQDIEQSLRLAASTSHGFGGHNGGLLFSSID